MSIQTFVMHQAGSIGGVPGPNSGLWPGGVIVYVDTDTMEVDHTSLIGGGSLPIEEALVQEETSPIEEPAPTNEPPQEEFPQVTPVENLEEPVQVQADVTLPEQVG
jgi:hypothetical protein